eukprot:TRINITY_DN593_c0_g1_i1.p1 TRINITY_DN593_c0_g1~~TRINITY_DN593_c0_g1_i1.p1  ORF type:complete len:153 (-),score=33.89 TRINITY_DN593_c0_g1_i1:179-610(-)
MDAAVVWASFNGKQIVCDCNDHSVRYIRDISSHNTQNESEKKTSTTSDTNVPEEPEIITRYPDTSLSMLNNQRIVSLAYLERNNCSLDIWDLEEERYVHQVILEHHEPYSISCDYWRVFMSINGGKDILVLDFSPNPEEVEVS